MVEDVLLRIGNHFIPTDFVILYMPEDDKLSVILGRPFLSTAGAYVYCAEGKIISRIYHEEIIRYFPKKDGTMVRYIPPPKRNDNMSVANRGRSEVCIPA